MSKLSFKTRKRSLQHLKQFTGLEALEAIKRSILRDLETANVASKRYLLACFEHKAVNSLIVKIEMGIN